MSQTASVLDALQAQLGPETIQRLSAQLGTDTAATSHAVSMAVPILLGRLSTNAASAEGLAALDTALDDHDGGILDDLGALLGGGGAGSAILRHILGSRRGAVEQGVGRATGLDARQVAQLLAMLAPLVMGVLGRMKRQKDGGDSDLPSTLGQTSLEITRQSTAAGDLSRALESEDDGQIADDLARIGASILGVLGQSARA